MARKEQFLHRSRGQEASKLASWDATPRWILKTSWSSGALTATPHCRPHCARCGACQRSLPLPSRTRLSSQETVLSLPLAGEYLQPAVRLHSQVNATLPAKMERRLAKEPLEILSQVIHRDVNIVDVINGPGVLSV